jgi:phosphoribosyl 1,2-cyclic phosphodiesterase
MEIICLASSSSGNSYLVKNDDTILLLEAGIQYQEIVHKLNSLGINITRVKAVAVTHEHGDHARSAAKLSEFMPVIASSDTLAKISGLKSKWPIKEWQDIAHVGSMWITGFYVDHDTPGAMGFIVYDQMNDEKLLFVNDTKFIRYNFSAQLFDYIYIECNYNEEIISLKDVRTRRTANSHMSLETVKKTLLKMNLTQTRGIYLMHLSDGNSDQNRMIKEVMESTGIPTYACLKNGGFATYGRT